MLSTQERQFIADMAASIAQLVRQVQQVESNNATLPDIGALVRDYVNKNADKLRGKDGESVKLSDVQALAENWLSENIKQPSDGKDAKQVTPQQLQSAVQAWAQQNQELLVNYMANIVDLEQLGADVQAYVDSVIKEPELDNAAVTAQIEAIALEWFNQNRDALRGQRGDNGSKGKDGKNGIDGVGIKSIEQVDNDLRVLLTDGKSYIIKIPMRQYIVKGGKSGQSDSGGSQSALLLELTIDPENPQIGQQWIKRTVLAAEGTLQGFFGAYPVRHLKDVSEFFYSVQTSDGVRRVELK